MTELEARDLEWHEWGEEGGRGMVCVCVGGGRLPEETGQFIMVCDMLATTQVMSGSAVV